MTESRRTRIVVGTNRDLIRTVAHRWRLQYGHAPTNPRFAKIQRLLDALDPEVATAAEVEAIIGNRSWSSEMCDVCEQRAERWVRLGEPPDYESTTLHICPQCLDDARKAVAA